MAKKSKVSLKRLSSLIILIVLFLLVGAFALKNSLLSYRSRANEIPYPEGACLTSCTDRGRTCQPGSECLPDPNEPGIRWCMNPEKPADIFCDIVGKCQIYVDPQIHYSGNENCENPYRYTHFSFKCCPTCAQQTQTNGGTCMSKTLIKRMILFHYCEGKCYKRGQIITIPTQPIYPRE